MQCSWFGLLCANKAHYPSQCSFIHTHPNESLSFKECLKDTLNYTATRLFSILWLLKPNVKWLFSVKEQLFYSPLCSIRVSYLCPCLSDEVQHLVGIFCCEKAALLHFPQPMKHQSMATLKLQAPFWHCPPTSRSSNYSSYKTSTLLLVKPLYNNTTKHFKEATQISREK